jgi:uncharacterized protein YggE
VAEKYIQTSNVYISPNYRNRDDEKNAAALLYYELSQTLTVTLEDISKYDKLIYPLLDLGINRVEYLSFSTSKLRVHRDEARLAAVKAAQEKAKLLTDAAGIKLGKPVNITEHSSQYRPSYGRYRGNYAVQNISQIDDSGADMLSDESSVSAGMISVSASVDITYEVQ